MSLKTGETSLLQAIENKDKNLIEEITNKTENGEVIRLI